MTSVPWRLETSKSWKKPKKSQHSEIALNRSQKCPNVFWTCFEVIFSKKKILTSVPWRLETSKSWKKSKKSQYSEFALNRSQKCPNVFWTYFEEIFSKKKIDQCSMEARDFKILKIVEKISKFQICPKSLPKLPNCVLNMFWGSFSKKNLPSVPWRVETSKNFKKSLKSVKIPKMSKIVPKSFQKCFGVIFLKIFYAQCSMEGRVLENFQNKIFSKFQKNQKLLPKVSKPILNMFWANFSKKKILPSVPWRLEISKNFKRV